MAAGRDRLCGSGYRDLGDADDPVSGGIMTPQMTVTYEAVQPKPVKLTIGGVSFWKGGAFATFYRMFEFTGMLEEFLAEAKPYYWKEYQEALRLKQLDEDRKREMHESYTEQRRQKENAKRRDRRLEKKNGISTTDNAVSTNPIKDLYHKGDYTTC